MDAKGIDSVKLSHLHSIVTAAKFDPKLMPIVVEASEDGPWVQELPAELVQWLTDASDGDMSDAASRWMEAAFDPRWHNVTEADLRTILAELASLCRRASTDAKSVLLWTCL